MNVEAVLKSKGPSVVTARPDATLLDLANLLSSKKIGVVVVIGDAGRVAGVFSERDLVHQVAAGGADVMSQPVSKYMTTEVATCVRSDTIDDMMDMMTKGRFRHVPVVEDGSLVGIVSIGDVVKHHIAEVELEVSAMRYYLNC